MAPILLIALSLLLILAVLLEAFEAVLLPRRVSRPLRLARLVTLSLWRLWRIVARLLPPGRRDDFRSAFGPISLLAIFSLWAILLIIGFALLHWGRRSWVSAPEGTASLLTYLYLSATTFVTLGFGDVAPRSPIARLVTDLEAGVGFGYLAIVISYLPVLYSAFARREVEIGLLDARASTPPSAGELLRRCATDPEGFGLTETLRNWERWSAELLESHLSYSTLLYYRSQHDQQSWLATLTTILDTSALLVAAGPETWTAQARLTFAMARHAAVDLRLVIGAMPRKGESRMSAPEQQELFSRLTEAGWRLNDTPEAHAHLQELRALYEPHVRPLSDWLELPLPTWLPDPDARDNWRTSADPDDHFFGSTTLQRRKTNK